MVIGLFDKTLSKLSAKVFSRMVYSKTFSSLTYIADMSYHSETVRRIRDKSITIKK